MGDKAWKALERKIAKKVGGERLYHSPLDVSHPKLAIEVKLRKNLAVWSWFSALEKKTPHGKLPVLILKQKGKTGELAVLRLSLLLKLIAGDAR
jgi:hypothetical protein